MPSTRVTLAALDVWMVDDDDTIDTLGVRAPDVLSGFDADDDSPRKLVTVTVNVYDASGVNAPIAIDSIDGTLLSADDTDEMI